MKRLNRGLRKRLSFVLAALMLVLSVPQTALAVEAKTGENTGIVSEMTVESEKTEEGSASGEVSEGTEGNPKAGETPEGTEETPETGETPEDSEGTPETGEGTEGSEETSDSGETSEDSEDEEETPETEENADALTDETDAAEVPKEISEAMADADTFEVDYIIYEVISEQDHTVRVKGMNREDFNKIHMNGGVGIPPSDGPVELTIPAAVESEQVTWQVKEIGEFALADYMYDEYNQPGNKLGADVSLGEYYSSNLYISKVIVSPGITGIGEGAFYRTFQIDEIVLPDTVVEIGEAAFYFDEELRYNSYIQKPLKVNIPAGVKTIERYAYHGVFFDITLKIPNGVEVIKEYAFACESEASGIYTVEIPSSVKKIERYAFDNETLINAVLYQPNSPFPDVLDGSAEIEYSSWMFGASDKELTLFVPESLMERYWFRLNYYLPNLQVRNINEYKEIKESPLRFLYDGSEITLLKITVSSPGGSEESRTITIDMEEADFQLDDIRWSFAIYGTDEKLTEEELKEYLRYEVHANGTMTFVGTQIGIITVTAQVDGYMPKSFDIGIIDGYTNQDFFDRVKALTAEEIAEMKKISYSPEIAFQLDEIRAMAEEITADCTSDRDKIRAVHAWLADHIAYDHAEAASIENSEVPSTACPSSSYAVLKNRFTVCHGYADLAEDMLRSIGIPCAYVSGYASGNFYEGSRTSHAWNMAYDGKEWIYFDATWDSIGDIWDNSISSIEVSEGRTLPWFDFDVEEEDGREFRRADFCEKKESDFRTMAKYKYITLFTGEEGNFQLSSAFHNVTVRPRDDFKDTDIIEVTAEGNIKALKPGAVDIVIEGSDSEGNDCYEDGYAVRVLKKESFEFDHTEIRIGTEDEYKVYCRLNKSYVNYYIELTSDAPDVVTVRKDGTLQPKKAGTAVITARPVISAAENKSETSCRVTVVEGKTIVDDGRFIYHILSDPSGSAPGTVEIIDHMLGKLNANHSDMLTKLEIPDHAILGGKTYAVIGIGKKAFSTTHEVDDVITWIREVALPDTLQYIEEYAFYGHITFNPTYTGLTVNFPVSLQRIEEGAFSFTLSGDVVFPEGSQLSYIGDGAFASNHILTKMDLSNCSLLREIGDGAFYSCSGEYDPFTEIETPGLSEVELPDGLKTIGARAFCQDNMLTSIRIPSTVEKIGDEAFFGTGLTGAIDISSVAALGKRLFSGSGIETVILPDALGEIPEEMFTHTTALNNILPKSYLEELGGIENVRGGIFKLPESVKSIGSSAFANTALTGTVDISGVSEIGRAVFADCAGIETVILPDGLDDIPEKSFLGIDNLKSVVSRSRLEEWQTVHQEEGAILLSERITKIGARTFDGCYNIRSVDAPGVKELGEEVFYSCKKLRDVTLSDELLVIPDKAFAWCDVLDGCHFGDHIESIGEQAFYFCGQLGNSAGGALELGSGIKSIGKWAFAYCTSVKKVTIYSTVIESIGEDCFSTKPVLYVYKLPSGIYEKALGSCVSEIIYLSGGPVLAETIAINPTETVLYVGDTKQLVCTVLPENTDKPETAWSSSDPAVVQVQDGLVYACGAGVAYITAATTDGSDLSAVCTVTVKEADEDDDPTEDPADDPVKESIDISKLQYAAVSNKTYTGEAIESLPNGAELTTDGMITLTEKTTGNSLSLKKGKDYLAFYKNNVNAGTASVTIVGIGKYTGSRKLTYKILPRNLEGMQGEGGYATAKVVFEESAYDYTGKAVKPSVTVRVVTGGSRSNTLKQGKDYTIKYTNHTKSSSGAVKKPTVTITGKGNYKGKITGEFEIAGINIADVELTPIQDQKSAAKKPVPVLKYNGKKLKNKTDFTLSYAEPQTDPQTGETTVSVNIAGKNNFTGSRTESFRVVDALISDKNVKITVSNKVYTGDGEASRPEIKVVIRKGKDALELKENTNYQVVYDPDLNAGKKKSVTVIGIGSIEGIGTFGGSKTITYKMTAKDINSRTADGEADIICKTDYAGQDFFYTGNAVKPKVVLIDNTVTEYGAPKVLTEKEDYILKYAGNKNVTTNKPAVITIVGKGNYKGTFSVKPEFRIISWNLKAEFEKRNGAVRCKIEDQNYAGKALKPAVVISVIQPDGTEEVLKKNTVYKATYRNNINAADKTAGTLAPVAVITPNKKAGMADSDNENIEHTFSIKPLDLADAVIKEIPDQKFKGEPVVPTPLVKIGKLTMQAKKGDIVFEYTGNSKRGIARLGIKPGSNGNFVGERSVLYLIK